MYIVTVPQLHGGGMLCQKIFAYSEIEDSPFN